MIYAVAFFQFENETEKAGNVCVKGNTKAIKIYNVAHSTHTLINQKRNENNGKGGKYDNTL